MAHKLSNQVEFNIEPEINYTRKTSLKRDSRCISNATLSFKCKIAVVE